MDVERLDDLRELIGEYWCLAFAEGQEGRNTDTQDGAAQKCISAIEAIIRETRAALTPPEGHVVVTRNEAGQAVAVTRQDDEGRILSVIAEIEAPEGHVPERSVLVAATRLRKLASAATPMARPAYIKAAELIELAVIAARPEVKP